MARFGQARYGAVSIVPSEPTDTLTVWPAALELADKLCRTEFVPGALRGRPEATLAAILTGREIGLPEMQSLRGIYIPPDGRPGLYAETARSLVQSRGHQIWVDELTVTRCTISARRRGEDHTHRVTWTWEDAERAHLAGRPNWQKYPRQMLLARGTGEICRLAFADVLGGMPYLAEEIADGEFGETNGQPLPEARSVEPTRRGPRRTRRQPRNVTPETETTAPPATVEAGEAGDTGPRATGDHGTAPPTSGGQAVQERPREAVQEPPAPPPPEPPQPPAPTPPRAATPPPPEPTRAPTPAPEQAADIHILPSLSLAQQIAMTCREASIDRRRLVSAVTGKTRASEVTREEAERILYGAREIASGRAMLREENGNWYVQPVTNEPELWGGDDGGEE